MKVRRVNGPSRHAHRPLSPRALGGGTLLALAALAAPGSVPAAPPARATPAIASAPRRQPAAAASFLRANCVACHNRTNASGKLDLTTPFRPEERSDFNRWVKVADRVAAGEMPPATAPQPTPAARKSFLAAVSQPLHAAAAARVRREGRATRRRMNRYEYENTLRDLLDAPWLQVREMLPEDGLSARFNKVGDALDVSHVQMSRYLAAAGYALREALAKTAARPESASRRYYARDQRSFGPRPGQAPERATFMIVENRADLPAYERRRPRRGEAAAIPAEPVPQPPPPDPAKREFESVGMVASSYEPLNPRFEQFRAPLAGRYRLRLRAHTFWAHPQNAERWWKPSLTEISGGRTHEPVTLYSSLPQGVTQLLRKLGTLDVGPESAVGEVEAWLLQGESIQPDPARLFRSRPPNWRNPLATPEGQPGVAFHWLEVEGPLYDEWPPRGHRLIAGDLPVKVTVIPQPAPPEPEREGRRFREPDPVVQVELVPNDPVEDAERLVRRFVRRALRRPAQEAEIQPFVKLFHTARAAGAGFTDALFTAYSGVLCSPAFVTLDERPGPLDDHALAARLSYFLWNSEPDATLRAAADQGALRGSPLPVVEGRGGGVAALAAQADRMLADPRAARFVEAFLDYWLDLRQTDITSPDELLYPDYYLDDLLTESAVAETRAFFAELLRGNLPARNLVASDFVMVNERLAALYGLPGVQGAAIRRVALPVDSVRGGLLTQAAVLKVTANGTTTSPVLRGAWITERILGQPVPPPPPSVPAVEPDTRGTTTIRAQLEQHRTDAACRSCHAKIDPPGFALESFDIFGGWRDRYRALGGSPLPAGEGRGGGVAGFGKNGQPFAFHAALPVDPSGVLPDGRAFKDVRQLKRLLLRDERQIARNLVRQLVTYSTGAPVEFGDRPKVEAILDRARAGGYGVRSLVHGILASELFRNK